MDALALAEKLVRHFEGCRLTAYRDSAGVWTIGWGHTGGVTPGQVITQEEADALLREDLDSARESVATALGGRPLGSAATAALLDFTFNLGLFALKQLLAHPDVGNQIERWVHAGGQVPQGLVKRRAVEAFLFSLGDL